MPAQLGYTLVTTTGRQKIVPAQGDNVAIVQIGGGTFATIVAAIQGNPFTAAQDPDGNGWQNLASQRMDTLAVENTPTITDDTGRSWQLNINGFQQVGINFSTVTSGTIPLNIISGNFPSVNIPAAGTSGGNQSVAGTLTVTSSSASALTVGRLGATTPAFQVDGSVSSAVTGVKVTGRATGAGASIAAIGSATDETLTVDAKGAGVIALGDTSTAPVYANRGSLKALQVALTLTALGTVQSSTPTSAQLLGGILTQTGATGAGTVTLPTGTNLTAACPRAPVVGDTFDCYFYNLGGSQTLTITGATGTTVIGTAAVGTGKMAQMKFYASGSNTWNIYCIVSA